ncbi:MAG: phosphatase PAP2 family protein [Nitrospira sp.]|nr:phosphatase PAP2 family protein [Nitrospira sp.]
MKRISPAVLLTASFIAWPHVSFSCDGVTIGPCAPGGPWKGSASGLESHDEPTGTEQVLDTVGSLGKQAIDDATYLLTSPLRIDRKSALIMGGIVAGVGGLMVADKTIQRAFQENRTEANDEIARTLETIGFSRTVLGANVALIGAGWLFRQHEEGNKLMRTALVSLESQMFVEGIAGLTKFAVGRARPGAGLGTQTYEPFEGVDKSFPSSHAARSFAVAAVFADAYPQPVPFLVYTGAALISLSRIHVNEHFASDVLAGAVLGFVVGKALSWRHQHPDILRGWTVLPFVPDARGGLGLTMEYRF